MEGFWNYCFSMTFQHLWFTQGQAGEQGAWTLPPIFIYSYKDQGN